MKKKRVDTLRQNTVARLGLGRAGANGDFCHGLTVIVDGLDGHTANTVTYLLLCDQKVISHSTVVLDCHGLSSILAIHKEISVFTFSFNLNLSLIMQAVPMSKQVNRVNIEPESLHGNWSSY